MSQPAPASPRNPSPFVGIVLLIALFILRFSCSGCGAALFAQQFFSVTPQPLSDAAYDYAARQVALDERLLDQWEAFSAQLEDANANPALLDDPAWRGEALEQLAGMRALAAQLGEASQAPSELERAAEEFEQASQYYLAAFDCYQRGLESQSFVDLTLGYDQFSLANVSRTVALRDLRSLGCLPAR